MAPLLSVDQSATDTGGPVGRLQTLSNAFVKQFRGQGGLQQVKTQKRFGFTQFPTIVRNPADGSISGKSMIGQTAMGTLANRLVTVAGAAAFVLSEPTACFESPNFHLPTQTLRAKNVPTANSIGSNLLVTPDSARIGTRTMYAWNDTVAGAMFVAIYDDDGTQVLAPFFNGSGGLNCKVVSDGTRFWTVQTQLGNIDVDAWDTNGVHLANNAAIAASTYVDAIAAVGGNGVAVAQKDPGSGTVRLTTYTFGGGVISIAFNVTFGLANTIVGFLRNDRGDGFYYVTAINLGGPYDYRVYQVTPNGTINHTYTFATGQAAFPFEITGYVAPSGNADLTIALGFLDTATLPGPFAFRNITDIWTSTFAGVNTKQTTKRSLTPASRPFQLNNTYYIAMFYQSDPVGSNTMVQSTFFLLNLSAPWQICGRWDNGTAYADWQNNRGTNFNFWLHLSTPNVDSSGAIHLALLYRQRSFTTRVTDATLNGVSGTNDLGNWANVPTSAIGMQDISIGADSGEPLEVSGALLFSGPQCVTWSGGQFVEDGIPLIPEIISVQPSVTAGSLITGQIYEYVVSAEWTDDAGNLVRGPTSPPFSITLTGGKTSFDIVVTNIHVSSKANLRLIIERTAFLNGQQSVQHYKVVSDLTPLLNNDALISTSFNDGVSDSVIIANEQCYTDKGYLDRFPAPPNVGGTANATNTFLIGYDNAIWFSGPKTEGDAWWFSPAFRIPIPTAEQVTKLVLMDSTLIIFCSLSNVFALNISNLPDATGNGQFPVPTLLPFSNGCTGHAVVTNDGIMYSSAQGGIWLVTRALQNTYIGLRALTDVESGLPVTSIQVDKQQFVYISLGFSGNLVVYDQIADQWYKWNPTSFDGEIMTVHKGLLVYAASGGVWRYAPNTFSDIDSSGTHNAIPQSIIAGKMFFGDIRGFVRLWNQQIQGSYLGAHTLNVFATYFIDEQQTTVAATYTISPVAGQPYVFELPPKVEEISSVSFQFSEVAVADSPGFTLEGFGFEVGIDAKLGRVATSRKILPT
jgi:hypothetical protein